MPVKSFNVEKECQVESQALFLCNHCRHLVMRYSDEVEVQEPGACKVCRHKLFRRVSFDRIIKCVEFTHDSSGNTEKFMEMYIHQPSTPEAKRRFDKRVKLEQEKNKEVVNN